VIWLFLVQFPLQVILVEALDHILSTYDQRISEYTESHFLNKNITLLMNSAVKEVKSDGVVVVRKGGEPETIPCGMTVWATGRHPFLWRALTQTRRNQTSPSDWEIPKSDRRRQANQQPRLVDKRASSSGGIAVHVCHWRLCHHPAPPSAHQAGRVVS
jgi:pyruvate/2-oxoglutarate dehydrogenase complex dihydrolipoamide dehydrogenase (E3) component